MPTSEALIAGLLRDRAAAATEAAAARCEQQLAAHRGIAQLYADRAGLADQPGAEAKVARLDGQIRELERLVDVKPAPLTPVPPPADDSNGNPDQGAQAPGGKP